MFKRMVTVFVWSAMMVPVFVQAQAKPQSPQRTPEQDFARLREQIAQLQTKITSLESKVALDEYFLKQKQNNHDQIVLNMTETSYQRLDTDTGSFLVSVEQAVPYLNGYKLELQIGNPSAASYAGYKLNIRWSKSYDWSRYTEASYKEWDAAIQQKEISFVNTLQSGTWNAAEVILVPATAEQLGLVTLSMSTNTVSLKRW